MLIKLFWFFLKLGFISIGGGYPMMGLIYDLGSEVGLTALEFADMTALELLSSGPIVLNAATYIGYIKAGILGSAISTLGVCLPSFFLTFIVLILINKFKNLNSFDVFLATIKITCGGVLLATALNLGKTILIPAGFFEANILDLNNIKNFLIFILCIIGLFRFKINPVKIIIAAGILGLII